MTRKCYNHRPYTSLWHHKEQTQNSDSHIQDSKSRIQVKSQISLPQPDYCKTRKDNKYYISKQGPNTNSPQTKGAKCTCTNSNKTTTLGAAADATLGGGGGT